MPISRLARSRLLKRVAMATLAALPLTAIAVAQSPAPASAATGWDVTVAPPVMNNPTRIELSASTPTDYMPPWGILCEGQTYDIRLGKDEDAIITMAGDEPLKYPIWIVGGRNVRVVGLEMALDVQPGCGVGQLRNSGSTATNIHPRLPGAMALRLENYGTSFVEGVDIDLRGHEADCFVVRNPADLTNAQARVSRNVVLQNTSCIGIEGLGQSDIGDGVHGDLLQNQGFDVMNTLAIENVSVRTSMEGLVLHNDGATAGAKKLTIRRFDYAADPRYVADDSFEQFGLAYSASAEQWTLHDVYLDDPEGNNYGFINDQRYGAIVSPYVELVSGVHNGRPSGGAFADQGRVGLGYVSPHDGLKGNTADRLAGAVKRLYQASFGRTPEPAGAIYWQQVARDGVPLAAIAATFQDSPEWAQRYGRDATPEAVVDGLYRNVLGRAGDAEGRAYWLQLLRSGQITKAQILLEFSESTENKMRTATK
ncbi:MAG: DUF4214 domain-containing protein [Acidimicrobiales bacterium]